MHPPVLLQDVLLRNVDPEGVRAIPRLIGDLPFSGEEPVDKNLRGVGMRRVLKQAYCAPSGSQSPPLLKVKDLPNRQALLHRPLCLARVARHAESEFARGKPINRLAVIAGKGYVHFTVKSPHEFRAKL